MNIEGFLCLWGGTDLTARRSSAAAAVLLQPTDYFLTCPPNRLEGVSVTAQEPITELQLALVVTLTPSSRFGGHVKKKSVGCRSSMRSCAAQGGAVHLWILPNGPVQRSTCYGGVAHYTTMVNMVYG